MIMMMECDCFLITRPLTRYTRIPSRDKIADQNYKKSWSCLAKVHNAQ